MKICILADTHLFSTEIGGQWSEDSFNIFREKILPKVKEKNPDILVFLGDIFLGKNPRMPNWQRGDEISLRFSNALKESGIKEIYALKGNHDLDSPLKNIDEMGTLHYIDDDWLNIGDVGLYFFTSRYPATKKAVDDLKSLLKTMPDPKVDTIKKRILLMHESMTIGERSRKIPEDVTEELSRRFYVIFNGHQHSYEKVNDNTWCVPSALPCIPWEERCDIFIEDKMMIEHTNQWGFFYIDTDKDTDDKNPWFEPVDIGINIIVHNLFFDKKSAIEIKEKLIDISKKLTDITVPEKTIIRIVLNGELNEGERKIDIGIPDIEKEYFSHFYEEKKEIMKHDDLREVGITNIEKLRSRTALQALHELEQETHGSIGFYREIEDFISFKTLKWEKVLQTIKQSEFFGAFEPILEIKIPKDLGGKK